MPIYQYRCPHCVQEYQDFRFSADRDLPKQCPECGTLLVRSFTPPAIPKPYNEGINRATGKYTTSKRQLSDDLKAASEKQFERTGFESNMVVVDPADAQEVHGVDVEDSEERYGKGDHVPDKVKWLT